MKNLNLIIIIIAASLFSCNTNAQYKMIQTENVKHFFSNFAKYKMDIQGAGIATIPNSRISNVNSLVIDYAYDSEGEKRTGNMTLTYIETTKQFEGKWKSEADNGNVYIGTLYFVLKQKWRSRRILQVRRKRF